MIRTLTLAAVAALTFTSAQAASKAVILNGKTPAQVRAEIAYAARAVCLQETAGLIFRHEAITACIKEVSAPALAEAEMKMAKMKTSEVLAAK